MSSISIAHFSDIHLPLEEAPRWRDLCLKRLLSFSSWFFKRRHIHTYQSLKHVTRDIHNHHPDLLALTGDVTNLGLRSEFKNARKWFEEENFKDILLVPGNHDTLTNKNNDDQEKFTQWFPWTKMKTANFARPSLLVKGNVALVGLNSAIPSLPFLATGRISSVQLAHLTHILRKLRKENYCRVIILHHSPLCGHVTNRKGLKNLRIFQEILRHEGAELILHGHSHTTNVSTIPRTEIPVVSAPSASQIFRNKNLTAGWNKICIRRQDNNWLLRIQPRLLKKNDTMHDSPHRYRCIRPF